MVRDPSGVPREAVTVRATNSVTGTTRSATTGPDGSYTIGGLAPGAYTVTGSSAFRFDPELPAYNLMNLRLRVRRGNWEAALYMNNVTDERAFLALDRERGTRAHVGYLTNQPRTIGTTLGFNY